MKKHRQLTHADRLALGAVAISAAILIALAPFMARTTSEQAKESVLVVDASVEVPDNPFLLFFSRLSLNQVKSETETKRIVHYRGTAFVVNGHLITAAHVVLADEGEKIISITVVDLRGVKTKVAVLRSDKSTDLAELAVADAQTLNLPSLRLARHVPKVGDSVVEIGHPSMIHYVVSRGTIVGFDTEQGYNIAALDTFGGNSGGPIINDRGEVVGVCHTLLRGSRFTGIGTLTALQDFLYPERLR